MKVRGIFYYICITYLIKLESYTKFLIDRCGIGLVPFEYFGSNGNKGWFRMSIGGVDPKNVDEILLGLDTLVFKSLDEVNSWII